MSQFSGLVFFFIKDFTGDIWQLSAGKFVADFEFKFALLSSVCVISKTCNKVFS